MIIGMKTKTDTNLTLDPDTESCVAMMRRMMALNVITFKPSIRSKSKEICTTGGMFVSIRWVDVYANASLMRSLCYINTSKNPLKIELSPRQARSAMWGMTGSGTIILWEKGPYVDGMGMGEFLDSFSKFSFRVPHN
jgi:hypothetical protein